MRLRFAVLVFLLLVAGMGTRHLGAKALEQRADWPIEESYVKLPDPEVARFTYAGYNQLAADVSWIRMLVYYGSGFLGEGDFRYLMKFVRNVITLDPQFKKVYLWAAYSVTVAEGSVVSKSQEDIWNSIEILKLAVEEYPDEYEYFWLLGVRHFLDLKSDDESLQRSYKEQGSEYMEAAMSKPDAPADLASKAASFRSQLGQYEQAQANLMQMIMTIDDIEAQQKMLARFENYASSDMADELARATQDLRSLHQAGMPQVSPNFFIVLGPAKSKLIEFDALATDRNLVGSEVDEANVILFP